MKVKKKNSESLPRHLFKQTKSGFFPFENHMSKDIPLSRSIIYYLLIRFIEKNILGRSDKTMPSNIPSLS